jgi:hypothetical protein
MLGPTQSRAQPTPSGAPGERAGASTGLRRLRPGAEGAPFGGLRQHHEHQRPRARGHRADEVPEAIRAGLEPLPACGVRKVWATLGRQEPGLWMRHVHAPMRAAGWVLTPAAPGHREGAPRGPVVTAEPSRRIAVDLATVYTDQHGLVATSVGGHRGYRSLPYVPVTRSQASGGISAPAGRALEAAFGHTSEVPNGVELRSDHVPQATGQDALALPRAWGVNHTFAPIGRPSMNALAERRIREITE